MNIPPGFYENHRSHAGWFYLIVAKHAQRACKRKEICTFRYQSRSVVKIRIQKEDDGIPLRGDAKKRIFHFSACEDYSCKQCSLEFKNLEVAIEAGFLPCDFCKTLIEEFRHPPSVS